MWAIIISKYPIHMDEPTALNLEQPIPVQVKMSNLWSCSMDQS